MEEYSSEEVYSLCFPTVRREYSSFGVEDWRSSLLSVQRSSLFSERSRERVGFFVFFSNREVFFSLSLSLEYICNIYSFFLCSLYFFSRESNSESSSSLLTAYVYRVYAAEEQQSAYAVRYDVFPFAFRNSKCSVNFSPNFEIIVGGYDERSRKKSN